jgi:hypothetical protein
MKKIILFLLLPSLLFSQNRNQQNKQLLAYNLAFGAIIGGVTELVANPRHVKPLRAFTHGFCIGVVGGTFNYAGKYAAGSIISSGKYGYVLPARMISSFGNSIIYNTGHSKNFYFQYFNFDYGPIQVSVDVLNQKVMPKLLLGAIGGIVASVRMGGQFDLKHSLLMGVPCFSALDINACNRGYTLSTSLTVNSNPVLKNYADSARSHEFIHVLQYMEYANVSNIALGWIPSYRNNVKVWKYVAVDLPYSDVAYMINSAFLCNGKYANNYFEFESRKFSRETKKPEQR